MMSNCLSRLINHKERQVISIISVRPEWAPSVFLFYYHLVHFNVFYCDFVIYRFSQTHQMILLKHNELFTKFCV